MLCKTFDSQQKRKFEDKTKQILSFQSTKPAIPYQGIASKELPLMFSLWVKVSNLQNLTTGVLYSK